MIHLGQQNCCFSFGSSDYTFVVERLESEGWETTGWEVRLPGSDGGLMDVSK